LLPPQVLAQGYSETDGLEFTVTPGDSVYNIIVDKFGTGILAKSSSSHSDDHDSDDDDDMETPPLINRRALGSIIFNDPAKRRMLNSITHPRILTILVKRLIYGLFWSPHDLCVGDIPLLFESGKLKWLFGLSICVAISDPAVQLNRLMKRNPDISKEECQARMDSQMSLDKKRKLADIVIDNDYSPQELSEQVENVRRELMARIYGIGMSLVQMLLLIGGSTAIAISSKFYTKWQV
jgi:dephospho-CoA kinase